MNSVGIRRMSNVRVSRFLDHNCGVEKKYEVLEEIGRGKFAVVKLCRNKTNGDNYAGKFIRKRRSRKAGQAGEVQNEISILQLLNHKNIVKLVEFYENPTDIILLLELVTGGELFQYLIERDKVTEEESTIFIRQILDAVLYLHMISVVHLDLKPENVVLSNKKEMKVKLIDFGLSVMLRDGVLLREITGTPEFVAPEIINFDPVTCAADMWSIGVMTYIMLSGYSPFMGDDDQETLCNVSRGEYIFEDQYFANSSSLSKDFIERLLRIDPRIRATAADCLDHSWIQPKKDEEVEVKRRSAINVACLKSFVAKRRWRRSFHIVSLFNHLRKSAKKAASEQKKEANETQERTLTSRRRPGQCMSAILDYESE